MKRNAAVDFANAQDLVSATPLPTAPVKPVRMYFFSNTGPNYQGLNADNTPRFKPAAGGLGRAIDDAMHEAGGVWSSIVIDDPAKPLPKSVVAANKIVNFVPFPKDVRDGHYKHKNELDWPANHQEPDRVVFDQQNYEDHLKVVATMGEHVYSTVPPGALCNIDDYQVDGLAAVVRRLEDEAIASGEMTSNQRRRISYFHHTPYVSPATLDKIDPKAADLLRARAKSLLENCDQVGFHTEEAAHNFLNAAFGKDYQPDPIGEYNAIRVTAENGRSILVAVTPISVPTPEVQKMIKTQEITSELKDRLNAEIVSPVVFYTGGARRDYSKRHLETVQEFKEMLDENPELIGKAQLLMVSIPTRDVVASYKKYSDDFVAAAKDLQDTYAQDGWNPLVLIEHELPNSDCVLIASMKGIEADPTVIGLLPIHQDGFNLTAAEMTLALGKGTLKASDSMGFSRFVEGILETFDATPKGAIKDVMLQASKDALSGEQKDLWQAQNAAVVEKLERYPLAHWTAQRVYRLMSEDELKASPHLNPDTYRRGGSRDTSNIPALENALTN